MATGMEPTGMAPSSGLPTDTPTSGTGKAWAGNPCTIPVVDEAASTPLTFGPSTPDPMPDCMKKDPIGPANLVWDVPQELINQVYQRLESSEELFTTSATG